MNASKTLSKIRCLHI